MMLNHDMQEIENRLAALTGRAHCVVTSRATSALFLAFRALAKDGGTIVFPAILCPSPAYAALYSGHRPIFCDIEPTTGNLCPIALNDLLARTPDVVAVMVAHLYGQPASMSAIRAVASQHNLPVIEDAAQALGASFEDGTPVGSAGNVGVLSFGRTKIVDAGQGGAIVTDDAQLADRLRANEQSLKPSDANATALAEDYRRSYYRARTLPRAVADEEFLAFPERYRSLYLYRRNPGHNADLLRALDRLAYTKTIRRQKAAIYDEVLDGAPVTPLRRSDGAVPWRFGILVEPDRQASITNGLRAAGFDASNWYPSLHRWFESGRAQNPASLPNAIKHEDMIINLWLDDASDEERVTDCAHTVTRLADKFGPTRMHP